MIHNFYLVEPNLDMIQQITSVREVGSAHHKGGCPQLMLVAYCVGVGVNQPVHWFLGGKGDGGYFVHLP